MTRRRTRIIANALLAFSAAGWLSAVLTAKGPTDAGFAFVFLVYAAVGWLVARQQPTNSVGWLFLVFGVLGSFVGLMWTWAVVATAWGLPGADLVEWMQTWMWAPVLGIVTGPLLAVFPDGRLLSPRWRIVPWLSGMFVVLAAIGNGFYPWSVEQGGPNPYAIEEAEPALRWARDIGGIALLLSLAIGIAAVVVRYRRAATVQRQQMKWFLSAAAVLPVAIVVGELRNQALQEVVVPIGLALVAVATGIAILRHGLYDIDRIISRTVGWALVTVVLAALYLAAVTVLTRLTSDVTGESPLAVAASTLLAAAAFQPVRRRIQAAVDRRFNRVRYDAVRTVESYRTRLREDLDLDTIGATLIQAAGAAVQPTTTMLWLREAEEGR